MSVRIGGPEVDGASIVLERGAGWLRARLDRPASHNSLDPESVDLLHRAMDEAEGTGGTRMLILEGSDGHFCSGMDLAAASEGRPARGAGGDAFLRLLRRFTATDLVIVSNIDGRASGGGVGLAAASDFAFASARSQFSLPEALWGLLPCVVAPFLIRRVGYQVCHRMTLSTMPVDAVEAKRIGLVDDVTEDANQATGRLLQRIRKVRPETVRDAKAYLAQMSILSEPAFEAALSELDRLLALPEVLAGLTSFAERKEFPWERQVSVHQGPAASEGIVP